MNYRFCQRCGARIPSNVVFCPHCGAKQNIVNNTNNMNNINPRPQAQPQMNIASQSRVNINQAREHSMKFYWSQFFHNIFRCKGCSDVHGYRTISVTLYIIGVLFGLIFGSLGGLYGLAYIICTWGLNVRRLHDMGANSWWMIFDIFGGVIFTIVLASYGSKPKNKKYKDIAIQHNLPPMV